MMPPITLGINLCASHSIAKQFHLWLKQAKEALSPAS